MKIYIAAVVSFFIGFALHLGLSYPLEERRANNTEIIKGQKIGIVEYLEDLIVYDADNAGQDGFYNPFATNTSNPEHKISSCTVRWRPNISVDEDLMHVLEKKSVLPIYAISKSLINTILWHNKSPINSYIATYKLEKLEGPEVETGDHVNDVNSVITRVIFYSITENLKIMTKEDFDNTLGGYAEKSIGRYIAVLSILRRANMAENNKSTINMLILNEYLCDLYEGMITLWHSQGFAGYAVSGINNMVEIVQNNLRAQREHVSATIATDMLNAELCMKSNAESPYRKSEWVQNILNINSKQVRDEITSEVAVFLKRQ